METDRPLRLFIAIELDERLKRELERVARTLKRNPAMRRVRWVAPEGIHLTLKFLGETPAAQVAPLREALDAAADRRGPFHLTAQGLGGFPNLRHPNNLWVSVGGDVLQATNLASRVEEECVRRGFPRDARPFSPHLTLGRLGRDLSPYERERVGAVIRQTPPPDLGTLQVDTVHLVESDLRPSGAIYTILHSSHLENKG